MSQPDVPARPSRFEQWQLGVVLVFGYLAVLYAVEFVDQLDQHRLDRHGIRPLQADGLWGILFAPFLHAGWQHLNANAGAILVLGLVGVFAGLGRFLAATAMIWAIGGFGTWLIGGLGSRWPTDHIGASGVIFGWIAFLILQGFFGSAPIGRRLGQIVLGLVVFFFYGAVLWGALPGQPGVSWQGHLCGALAGALAAFMLSKRGRPDGRGVPPRV
ncbi:Rhomboid family protein [Segniliparus rotundus DSM 44985]|uniref:Rhomboid family protein n=2 Tax=Segniliparus rotundus TaxID=286802 RepID=D6ZCC3_SEGRD|nr:Rhomboid family protein [Segniliparus rotundus DSM 44985]